MPIDKVTNATPTYITKQKLQNGDTRYTYISSKCYYDLSKDGSIKYYDSQGVLSNERKPNGDCLTYKPDGSVHSKVSPDGCLTLYNEDGTINKILNPVSKKFSKIG